VSQIPFLEDFHHASAGVHEIWCSSREFLTLTYGDWEEHAVLLCNYFKFYEGKESPWSSFVVLGHAVPEGKTSYVLRVFRGADQYGNDRIERAVLYNAVSGETWDVFSDDVSDVDYCPLQRVGCVFDNQNVWANIQNHDNPRDMDFNLNNTNLWKPLKRKEDLSLFEQVQSLQQPVRYFYTDPVYYQERAVQLESLCERAFETWRLGKPLQLSTSWDYSARGVFRDMLATFEQVKQKTSHEPDKSMLAQLNKAYDNIFGFPLNFTEACDPAFMSDNPFENPVLIALRNTRLHEIKETGVQFGLAVHIERYPNKIGSVWLYIAALSPHS
jgi:coiled-coil and C2 domain-containing protein 2A